jgi:putative DNA primase/helicase
MSIPLNHCISFQEAMASTGVNPQELPIDDGELHRFRVDGDKANALNGWYVLHGGDFPAGAFGCWKRGINQTWSAISKGQMTDKQRKNHEKRLEEAKNKRDYERRERQRNAAIKSGQLWIQAETEVDSKHPYLIAKQIQPLGIRQLNDTLLIPIQNALQELVNLQRITFDGQKRFMYGGAVQSCYTVLGELLENAYLCEGYATGVTIHQATQQPVIIAFNAGNLSSVIKSLAITNPKLKLMLAADNDHQNEINVGIDKAWMASIGFDIPLVYPDFESNDPSSDFNDLANTKGIEAVKEQLSIIREGVPKCQNT